MSVEVEVKAALLLKMAITLKVNDFMNRFVDAPQGAERERMINEVLAGASVDIYERIITLGSEEITGGQPERDYSHYRPEYTTMIQDAADLFVSAVPE